PRRSDRARPASPARSRSATGVVPAPAARHLVRAQPEQEEVLLAPLLRHLDGRAVACADRESPIHHVLHVAGAARLVARGGDLVRDVGRSEEHTSELQSRGHLVCRLLLEKKKKKESCRYRMPGCPMVCE